MNAARSLAITAVLATALAAQCTLTTTTVSNIRQHGNMFDLVSTASTPIEIRGLAGNYFPGQHVIQVFARTGGGTHVGFEQNPNAWTSLGTATITSNASGTLTEIPLALSLIIPPGGTQALYVTAVTPAANSLTGIATGSVATQDAFLRINQGSTNVFPFGTALQNRIWSGTVAYRVVTPDCPATPWQMNQLGARLRINGLESNGREPAVSLVSSGSASTLELESPLNLPWDLGLTTCTNKALGQGGVLLPSGNQVINLDFLNPSFRWLGPGTFTAPILPTGLPFSLTVPAPNQTLSVQMAILDPTAADGISLSQAATLAVANRALSMPLGDDAAAIVPLTSGATCIGAFPFAGTSFTEVAVETNGRVRFSSVPSLDFSPSVAEARTQAPFFGYWTDLENRTGLGRIATDGAHTLRFEYAAHRIRGRVTDDVNFALELDVRNGHLSIDGLLGIPTSTNEPAFLGLSVGSLGAIDLGPVAAGFQPGTSGTSIAGSMLYTFGSPPPGLGATDRLVFRPVSGLVYSYSAF